MNANTVDIFLQARMGSTRLPGKALMELVPNLTLLDACIDRLRSIRNKGRLIILTTISAGDDILQEYGQKKNILVFRGIPDHVLSDFYKASCQYKSTDILRATGDDPLLDYEEAEKLIKLHFKEKADYTTNRSESESGLPVGLPVGTGVEIFTAKTLKTIFEEAKTKEHWMHVNEYIFDNKEKFKISVLPAPKEKHAPNLEFSVDTFEQLEKMRKIYKRLYKKRRLINLTEAIRLVSP